MMHKIIGFGVGIVAIMILATFTTIVVGIALVFPLIAMVLLSIITAKIAIEIMLGLWIFVVLVYGAMVIIK